MRVVVIGHDVSLAAFVDASKDIQLPSARVFR